MKQQRYVMIRGQVFRWEEKAPFTVSGRSILGGVEVRPDVMKSRCHECGRWFKRLGQHISRKFGHVDLREYKLRHGLRLKGGVGVCSEAVRLRELHQLTPEESQRGLLAAQRIGAAVRPRLDELRNQRGLCEAQLPFRLRALAAEHGHSPASHDQRGLVRAAVGRYGSWNNALRAAGLPVNAPLGAPRAFSAELVVEMLRDFYVLNQRLPLAREWGSGRLPSYNTARKIFGTVQAAYEAAGLGLVAEARGSAA